MAEIHSDLPFNSAQRSTCVSARSGQYRRKASNNPYDHPSARQQLSTCAYRLGWDTVERGGDRYGSAYSALPVAWLQCHQGQLRVALLFPPAGRTILRISAPDRNKPRTKVQLLDHNRHARLL